MKGLAKSKKSKLRTYKGQFKSLKIKEENIVKYTLRVDEIVNAIKGVGGEIKEKEVVEKVIRTLPIRYNPKVSTVEYRYDLEILIVDELHGIFTAYEMRTKQNGPSRKESTFKATKQSKKYEALPKNQLENSNDEEALFIKKLEKGTDKYRRKLPLKCFNCGRSGHFPIKCPYPKQEDNDDEEPCSHKKDQKSKTIYKQKFNKKKKNFYSMEESEDEEIRENEGILFMGLETQTSDDESDVEGEAD